MRVFWHGRHDALGGSTLGKLHPEGVRLLETLGWRAISRTEQLAGRVAFAWPTRRGADFAAVGENLPLVRPLPQSCTDVLDDKVRLARALADADCTGCAPETHTDLDALRREIAEAAAPSSSAQRLWFVKHRHGVKGQAVRPMHDAQLRAWLGCGIDGSGGVRDRFPSPPADFVVQAEVFPPALHAGRKFVLRAHVLVVLDPPSPSATAPPSPPPTRAYLHHDVICLPHSAPLSWCGGDGGGNKAEHVSQSGRGHPPPQLTRELPADHPAAAARLWPCLRRLVERTLCAGVCAGMVPPASARCSTSTLFAMLGFDVALDAAGSPWLLEVNAHPAIGSGTMSGVETGVYTRLVADLASLVVLPALDPAGTGSEPGGFEAVEIPLGQ